MALPQQARVLLRRARRPAWRSASTAAAAGTRWSTPTTACSRRSANNAARNEVRDWARREGIPAYDQRSRPGVLRNLVVREGRRTGQLQTRLVTSPAELRQPPGRPAHRDRGPRRRHRRPHRRARRGVPRGGARGLRFRVSPFGLLPDQHRDGRAPLRDRRRARGADRDASGSSTSSAGSAPSASRSRRDAGEVWGIEIVPEAIADAEENARRNGIANARFLAADARLGIRPLLEEAGRPDVVVVDPPRAGLSKKIVRRLIECEAPRIVYVSCNPTTLAPNAAQLAEAGYRLRRVKPVDMFPQTPHIECVALLERSEQSRDRGLRSRRRARPRGRRAAGRALRGARLRRRCGPTTTRARTGWTRSPPSPQRRRTSSSGSR